MTPRTENLVLPADDPTVRTIGLVMTESLGIASFNPAVERIQIMMNHLGINLTITCKKDEILTKLRVNRDLHSKLVTEARIGYVERAQVELAKKMGLLKEGKIVALVFLLKVPKDFTTVYDTTIGMLEAHTKDEIELTADEYRHLIEDNWEWTRDFLLSNSSYSKGTSDYAVSKGFFDIE